MIKHSKKTLENLGMDARINTTHLPVRQEINEVIDRIGKDLTQPGLKYVGSVAMWIYVSNNVVTISGGELAVATNFTQNDGLSPEAVVSVLDLARVDIAKHFTSTYKKENKDLIKS